MLSIFVDEKWPDSNGLTDMSWTHLPAKGQDVITGVAHDSEELPKTRKIELVVPASIVSLTSVDTPKQNQKVMMKALRFAVEEQVIDDPEVLHVAPADDYSKTGRLPVAIIDRKWLTKTLDLLAEKEIFPEAVRVETLLLPIEENGITVVWNGKDGFMKTGEFEGGALDTGDTRKPPTALKMAIDNARANGEAPEKIAVYLTDNATAPNTALWGLELGTRLEIKEDFWNLDSEALDIKRRGINLLQGDITPSHNIRKVAKRGRFTAGLFIVVILAHSGFVFTDWLALKMESERLQTKIHGTFKTAFPKARAIVDPPLQMRRNLAELRWRAGGKDNNDLIPMLVTITQATADTAKIESFEYNKGVMKIDIVTPTKSEFSSAHDNLIEKGLDVKSGAGKLFDYGLKTRITVIRKNMR